MRFFFAMVIMGVGISIAVIAGEVSVPPNSSQPQDEYSQAVQFLKNEDYDAAIEGFQKALIQITAPTEQARVYNLIGLAYLKQGKSPLSAAGSFEQAIRLDPKSPEAYFNLASAYASDLSDPIKAAEYFQKTIEVDPQYSKAYFGLGWFSLMEKKEPLQALEYFEKTLARYPGFAEAHYGMGLAYISLQKQHMALGSISQLRAIQRDDLAAVLEKALEQTSPVQEVQPRTTSDELVETSPAPSASVQVPVEVVMRGKLVPLSKTSADKSSNA